ncbi:MAG: HNH endonuclease, partial [Gammaproteobacteria bacterium]|nr:HNH endonuclease [Gammaproteobacteria bacterium]
MVGESVIYNGLKYWRRDENEYFARIYKGKLTYLHRQVWADVYGSLPKNMEIHHVNRKVGDNSIENLELLPRKEHKFKHRGECSDKQ